MNTLKFVSAVAVLGSLLLAGCSAPSDEAVETTTSSAAAPATKTRTATPTPTFSEAEQQYLDAKAEELEEDTPEDVLEDGEEYCEYLDDHYSHDPMSALPAMIENTFDRDSAAARYLCPEYAEAMEIAETGFHDGSHKVVDNPSDDPFSNEISPGTYRTFVPEGATGIHDCYWERTSSGGDTIANDFVTLATDGVTVTVASGEGFVSENCGSWLPVR